jgi:hypothetical protein
MTVHRTDAAILFDVHDVTVNASKRGARQTAAIDVTVSAWTADLGVRTVVVSQAVDTSVSAAGFVDFDALDSVHASSATSFRR